MESIEHKKAPVIAKKSCVSFLFSELDGYCWGFGPYTPWNIYPMIEFKITDY
jgi:hypothetical protein